IKRTFRRHPVILELSAGALTFPNSTTLEVSRIVASQNRFHDLALCDNSKQAAAILKSAIQWARRGLTLETLLVDGRLVSYGRSSSSDEEVRLGGFTAAVPAWSGPGCVTHIGMVARHAFEQRASKVSVSCNTVGPELRSQLIGIGFVPSL